MTIQIIILLCMIILVIILAVIYFWSGKKVDKTTSSDKGKGSEKDSAESQKNNLDKAKTNQSTPREDMWIVVGISIIVFSGFAIWYTWFRSEPEPPKEIYSSVRNFYFKKGDGYKVITLGASDQCNWDIRGGTLKGVDARNDSIEFGLTGNHVEGNLSKMTLWPQSFEEKADEIVLTIKTKDPRYYK